MFFLSIGFYSLFDGVLKKQIFKTKRIEIRWKENLIARVCTENLKEIRIKNHYGNSTNELTLMFLFFEVFKNWVHGADKGAFILIPKHWQFENIMFSLYHPKYLKSVKSVYMYIFLMFTFTFHCCFKIVLILVSLTEETCSLTSSLFIFVNSKILIKINIEKILKHYFIWFVWKNPIKYQK